MTARHEGDDRPHRHLVDPAALATANLDAMRHLGQCVVCALARITVLRRAHDLEALGDIAEVPSARRDQLYAETRNLYCSEGQQLVMAVGKAAFGPPVFCPTAKGS